MQMMRNLSLAAVAVFIAIGSHSVNAGSATANLAANKAAPLQLIVTGIMVDCSWAPGTKVATLGTTGGDGKAVTYTFGGTPTPDLAISGNTIIIGPSGIAPANCGTIESISITGTQP